MEEEIIKYIGVDMAKAGMDRTVFSFTEVCLRKWYNPMRYIKGHTYFKNVDHLFTRN